LRGTPRGVRPASVDSNDFGTRNGRLPFPARNAAQITISLRDRFAENLTVLNGPLLLALFIPAAEILSLGQGRHLISRARCLLAHRFCWGEHGALEQPRTVLSW
jgi:hypothetical protein